MSWSTRSNSPIQSRGPVQPKNLVKFPVHFNWIYSYVSTWNLSEARRTSKAMMSSGSLPMSVTKRAGVLVFNPWSWACIACVREAATEMKVNMVLAKFANTALGLDWFWPKWWESDWAEDKSLFINILYIAATTSVVISSRGPLLSQKYSERWRNIRLGSREAI